MYAHRFQPLVLDRDWADIPRSFEALQQGFLADHFRKVNDFLVSLGADPLTHVCFYGSRPKEDGLSVYTYVLVPLGEWSRVEGLTLEEAALSYPSLRLEWTSEGVVAI